MNNMHQWNYHDKRTETERLSSFSLTLPSRHNIVISTTLPQTCAQDRCICWRLSFGAWTLVQTSYNTFWGLPSKGADARLDAYAEFTSRPTCVDLRSRISHPELRNLHFVMYFPYKCGECICTGGKINRWFHVPKKSLVQNAERICRNDHENSVRR